MRAYILLAINIIIIGCQQVKDSNTAPHVIMDIPGHPYVFEMNIGETIAINRGEGNMLPEITIRLNDVKFYREHNLWFPDTIPQENIYRADISVEINGKPETLLKQGYQSPQTIAGYRWYVETIVGWETSSQVDPETDLEGDIRISVCGEHESWGPTDNIYPIRDYRWHASSYMNTWSALVPYNHLYYHRGEDMAAIPDKLDVLAIFEGRISSSPYPAGDSKSNGLSVDGTNGFGFRLAHMNTETILSSSAAGLDVTAGQVLGKTGETWDGYKSQTTDPHLHVSLYYDSIRIGSYPYLMEAYFRDYPDEVLAVAGGYRFGIIGDTISLDGTRSQTAPGSELRQLMWITHTGDTIRNSRHQLIYDKAGLYSEQLIARTMTGEIDMDFLQVRIFEPQKDGHDIVSGHVHYWPVRDIHSGDSVLFWNRLVNNDKPVRIDFGDGSPSEIIEDEIWHAFSSSGNYVVTYNTSGSGDGPATIQLEVVVE